MLKKASCDITSLLGNLPVARKLRSSLKTTSPLKQQWDELLDQPLGDHAEPIHYENETLTIAVDGAIWGTELRHNISAILRKLHVLGYEHISQIKIIVRPENIGPNRQDPINRPLVDDDALQGLTQSAGYVKEKTLAKAIANLKQTLQRKPN